MIFVQNGSKYTMFDIDTLIKIYSKVNGIIIVMHKFK